MLLGLVMHRDTLAEGEDATLTYLLHEAAHVLNWVRGVKDTTIRGAYHNQDFRRAALEIGLAWITGAERVEGRGFISLELSPQARETFQGALEQLAVAIPQTLPYITVPQRARTSPPQRLTAECQCATPRKLKIAPTVWERGPVICGVCGKEFAVSDS